MAATASDIEVFAGAPAAIHSCARCTSKVI